MPSAEEKNDRNSEVKIETDRRAIREEKRKPVEMEKSRLAAFEPVFSFRPNP